MKGIYIHIPFCRKACRYCDFCFTVSLKYLNDYMSSLKTEIIQRKDSVEGGISTVYFGGGTPSVLGGDQLKYFMEFLNKHFDIFHNAEITFEANPDDLSLTYLNGLKESGINRLSIGAQSFREADLLLMNRSHKTEQTQKAIYNAVEANFKNISLDLIYGLPDLSLQAWQENLEKAFLLPVQHISAYHLTYEKDTIFNKWLEEGRIKELEEDVSVAQYLIMDKVAKERGFDHYEVSNFAKKGFRSQHNSIYWNGNEYIGFGVSAHTYDGSARQWNLDSVKRYIKAVNEGRGYFKREELSEEEKYHDYLVTRLRTKEGIKFDEVAQKFGDSRLNFLKDQIDLLEKDQSEIDYNGKEFKITTRGWLRLDTITRMLMI